MHPILYRTIWIGIAFVTGWLIYMISMLLTSYDGLWSLVFQPIMAGIFSLIGIVFSLLVGLIFRFAPLDNWWRSTYLWAALGVTLGLATFVLAYPLGFTTTVQHFETGADMEIILPELAITAYLLTLFALTNWPQRLRSGSRGGES